MKEKEAFEQLLKLLSETTEIIESLTIKVKPNKIITDSKNKSEKKK